MKTRLFDVYEVLEIEEKDYLYVFLFSHGKNFLLYYYILHG